MVGTDAESARAKPRGLKAVRPDPIPFPQPEPKPAPKKRQNPFFFLEGLKAWTAKDAESKEEEIRNMWRDYGEWADQWLQRKTGDANLVIWDFTDKELDAIVKWCLKRGQTTPIVARALDMALDGKTDVNFAVIMGSKTLETGYVLGIQRRGRRAQA